MQMCIVLVILMVTDFGLRRMKRAPFHLQFTSNASWFVVKRVRMISVMKMIRCRSALSNWTLHCAHDLHGLQIWR